MTTEEIKALQKELDLLYQVAQAVSSFELSEVLNEIVRIAAEVTGGDSVLVYLLDKQEDQLVLRASSNPHQALLQKIKLKLGEGITGWVAQQLEPLALPQGASKDVRFKGFRNLPEDRFEAFLSVPILGKRGLVGVINVQHKQPHQHAEMEIKLLAAVGKLVGGAVENALLLDETLALKEALAMRKVVERAKGVLMRRRNLSEPDAYKLLQKESMDTRKSIKEVAEAVLLMDKLSFGE